MSTERNDILREAMDNAQKRQEFEQNSRDASAREELAKAEHLRRINMALQDASVPTLTTDNKLLEELEKELKVYDDIIDNADAQIAELTKTRDATQRCRAALNAAREHLVKTMPRPVNPEER